VTITGDNSNGTRGDNPISSGKPHDRQRACGAKTRSGGTCRQPAMPNGRCRLHGGKTPGGVASPHFRHGRYSKYLPKHLQADDRRVRSDPELVSVRDELALIALRKLELVKRLSRPLPPWNRAVAAFRDYESALESGNAERVAESLEALRLVLTEGADAHAAYERTWNQLRELVQEKGKLSQVESKRMAVVAGYVSVTQLVAVLTAVLSEVKERVRDRVALQAIQNRVDQLMGEIDPAGDETEVFDGEAECLDRCPAEARRLPAPGSPDPPPPG
jgi:hypothetical protein